MNILQGLQPEWQNRGFSHEQGWPQLEVPRKRHTDGPPATCMVILVCSHQQCCMGFSKMALNNDESNVNASVIVADIKNFAGSKYM